MASPHTSPEQASQYAFGTLNLLMQGIVRAYELGAEQERRAEIAENSLSEMEERAMLDPLTGLGNRRAFAAAYQGLEETYTRIHSANPAYRRADDVSESAAILMLDIDHFKSINDSLGHDGGDEVLRTVAGTMNKRTRNRDLVARLGGEEFAILLPRISTDSALKIAEDIRKGVASTGKATISIGVTPVDLGTSLKDNLKRADIALYSAKNHGRDKVVQFGWQLPEAKLALIAKHGYLFDTSEI